MRNAAVITLLALLLLAAGCISEKDVSAGKKEKLAGVERFDVNGDGAEEYDFYTFAANGIGNINATMQRYLFSITDKSIIFNSYNDIDQQRADAIEAEFEAFISEKEIADDFCSQNLGISSRLGCIDPAGCLKICSSASQECSRAASENPEIVGASVLQYAKDNSDAYDLIQSIRNEMPKLKNTSNEKKKFIAEKLVSLQEKVSSMNANPLARPEIFGVCVQNADSLVHISAMLRELGDYDAYPEDYQYRSYVKLISKEKSSGAPDFEEVLVRDSMNGTMARTQVVQIPELGPASDKSAGQWVTFRPLSDKSMILYYGFDSTEAPDEVAAGAYQPEARIKSVDLGLFGPTIAIINGINGIVGNYYIALGAGIGLSIAIVLAAYFAITVGHAFFKTRNNPAGRNDAIKKAVGKQTIRWKSDIISGIVFLAIGIAIAAMYAPAGKTSFDLFGTLNLFATNMEAIGAVFGVVAGIVLIYTAIDNRIRLYILEQIYGKQLEEDKYAFNARVTQLKGKIAELKTMVETFSSDSFDVGTEYDLISRISIQHIDEIASKPDINAKRTIEEYMRDVDGAINGIMERRRTSDSNWPAWKAMIKKLTDENEEVHAANLSTIPSSLRIWALDKFVKENPASGLVLEGEALKRKQVTAEKMSKSLLDSNLLLGAVVLKNGKLFMSQVTEGSATLAGVLVLKLMNYLRIFGGKLRMGQSDSLAVVGDKTVIALIKYRDVESVVLVRKEKFREAVEDWKNKIRSI